MLVEHLSKLGSPSRTSIAGWCQLGNLKRVCAAADHHAVLVRNARALIVFGGLCALVLCACIPAYESGSIHLGNDGVVYIHNATQNVVFRYVPEVPRHLKPVRLQAGSRHVAYSPADHVLYVAYEDGRITRIDLANGTTEAPFVKLPAAPEGLVMMGSLLLAGRYVVGNDGTILDDRFYGFTTTDSLVWSDAARRIYAATENSYPENVYWIAIDPVTGQVGSGGRSPYWGEFPVRSPLRVSRDGKLLLTGAGLLYDAATLQIRDALPVDPIDAVWLEDGLVTLSETAEGATQLDQWNADRSPLNRQVYPGRPFRILARGSLIVVVTEQDAQLKFHVYVPGVDPDGDGAANADDAFPLDRAASADSDLDGYPDAWNPGVDPDASGTDLAIDAFPADSACWLPEHGEADVCDVARSIPDFDPDDVVVGTDGIAYLLATELGRIFRWSLAERRYLNPIVTDGHPSRIAYSPLLHRLYLAYPNRALTVIELASTLDERPFAATFQAATGLAVADPYVVASEPSDFSSHHSFTPAGVRVTWAEHYGSSYWAWSAARGRLYHFRDVIFPNDLHWESINAATGAIGANGESPYHGDFEIVGPIRLSPDESRVLLGSGDLYDASTLAVVASLPIDPVDASWPEPDSLLTLRSGSNGDTVLDHWDAALRWRNTARFPGEPRRVLAWSGGVAVMTLEAGRPRFAAYVASDDADGDGVSNDDDSFDLDAAASLDSDGDGRPDAWNPGKGPADSNSGLELDAFPLNSACWLDAQGTGGVCDVAAALPAYVPDRVEVGRDDVVYLLSRIESRIFRWSASSAEHLDPIVLAAGARDMVYSADTHRLYVGYQDGRITWIDPAAPVREHPFAVLHSGIWGLTAFGPFLFAVDSSKWIYVHRANGELVQRADPFWRRGHNEWDAARSRLYQTCDGGGCHPDEVHWMAADPVTGIVGGGADSPYHWTIDVKEPIRIETNGDRFLDGTGQVWDAASLLIDDALPWPIADARWDAIHLLALRSAEGGTTRVEQRDPISLADWGSSAFDGTPIRLVPWSHGFVVVTQLGDRPAFFLYSPPADVDHDGSANLDDAFPLDPAAASDADGDDAPDAWNLGYGPDDSTLGLTLDAFPDDFACQLPEHGVAGACDFAEIVPPDVALPLCSSDAVASMPASGWLAVPAAVSDLVPLCDGWVAYGDKANERLVVQDVFSGRLGLAVPLSGTPVDLELDAARKRIYVAVENAQVVEQVDLVTGGTVAFSFPAPVRAVKLDVGSKLIVSTTRSSEDSRDHYRLDVDTNARDGPIYASHFAMQWNPVRREFLSAYRSGCVARQVVDFQLGYTYIESAYWGYQGEALALSPDLQHVAFATREASGNSIAHYASGNLATRIGIWRGADFPFGVAFDLTSERLAASSNASIQIFSVASHALLDSLSVAPCPSGQLREVGFSRGGAMAFVNQACGASGGTAQLHWLRLD